VAGATLVVGLALVWLLQTFGGDPRLPASELDIAASLQRIFVDPRERFWFIFGPITPDAIGSGVRRMVLATSIAICLALPLVANRLRRGSRRLVYRLLMVAKASVAMSIACVALVAMVAMAPVTRLSFDYGRWLIWVPEIIILAAPFVSGALVLRDLGMRRGGGWSAPSPS
jgi:uncharacterized integral membrane protein